MANSSSDSDEVDFVKIGSDEGSDTEGYRKKFNFDPGWVYELLSKATIPLDLRLGR